MDRPGRAAHHNAQKFRRPLTDATSRANSATPPSRNTKVSPAQHGYVQQQLPHNESLLPQGNALTVHHPAPVVENKYLANVAKADGRTANRDSAISNSSTHTNSSHRRKTHIGPWQLGKTIGEGGCSRVRAVRHCVTGQLGAAKIISKKTADKVKAQSLLNLYKSAETDPKLAAHMKLMPFGLEREIVIMKLLNHPNIVKLFDVWENRSELYLIMEYVEGGELFGYIDENVGLPEMETVFIFRQIVAALLYCHRIKIHHRDLKPENILIDAENLTIKLVDFGMAALQPEGRWLSTPCGSPHYAAPEVIRYKQYDGGQADVWSCGVILYVMLTGQPPFTYNDRQDLTHLFKIIAQARYHMPDNLSDEAQDLISKILVPDPRHRINIEGVWQHPFLHKYDAEFGFDEESDREIWSGPKPRISSWDVRHPEDVDKETLRNMRCLWHSDSEKNILQKLMNNDANQEKFFYRSLQKYKEQQLEHWPGEPEIAYSASDYHHVQPARPDHPPPVPHGRTKSQFSILNDEHLQSPHSFQQPPPSEKSYDPFRSSREPSIANKGNYMNVTVHRGSTQQPWAWKLFEGRDPEEDWMEELGTFQHPFAWQLEEVDCYAYYTPKGISVQVVDEQLTLGELTAYSWSRLTVTEATLAQCTPEQRKHLQEAAEEEQQQQQQTPIPPVPSTPAQTSTSPAPASSALKNTKPRLKIKAPETPGRAIDGEVRKASVELEKALDEAFNRTSVSSSVRTSSERPTPFEYETPPSSVSYRGSGASAYTADVQALKQPDTQRPLPPLPPEAANDSPNTYLARELAETRERLAARFALEGGENTANYNEVLHSLDRLLHPPRQTQADVNQRSVSAPQHQSPQHPRLLPIISEEGKSTADANPQVGTPNWRTATRSATAPVSQAVDRYHGDQTIRVVDASSPIPTGTHIPPLNIRKKASGSTLYQAAASGAPTPTRSYHLQPSIPATPSPVHPLRHKTSCIPKLDQTPSPFAQRNSLDAATQTTPAQTPAQVPTPSTAAKEEKVTKKRSWFKRRVSDRDQSEQQQPPTDYARRPRIPEAWQGLDDRLERPKPRAVSSYTKQDKKAPNASTSSHSSFPMRDSEKEKIDKLAGLKKNLATLFGKKTSEKKERGSLMLMPSDYSASSLRSSGFSFGDDFEPSVPRYTEGQNWLSRFLHIKPVTKILAFQCGRGRARQEIVRLLREWKRFGVRDVKFDRTTNIIQASVDKNNREFDLPVNAPSKLKQYYETLANAATSADTGIPQPELQMKPVSFTAELFTVLQQGRRAHLCAGRFTQTRGAASSFRRVVDIIEDVLKTKGLLIEDEIRAQEVANVLNG
ncbi:Camk camkl gin4 protein kinase [Neofusicoccum parvum]|uniref:Camk camkl gin4 protein kinase n=1 Tax=Neofusicoccum parvum TaxID=310453 RepID=A0ACB5RVQ3_9PEZI|nr:Camk camkl gin4 protein kinase [Neofusicoccum parvum]